MNVINTYHVAVPAQSSVKAASFLAVLTTDDAGLYAVYIGITHLNDPDMSGAEYRKAHDKAGQWVAHNGLKQSYKKALAYFPDLAPSEYRS
jgi:hypothetical protein